MENPLRQTATKREFHWRSSGWVLLRRDDLELGGAQKPEGYSTAAQELVVLTDATCVDERGFFLAVRLFGEEHSHDDEVYLFQVVCLGVELMSILNHAFDPFGDDADLNVLSEEALTQVSFVLLLGEGSQCDGLLCVEPVFLHRCVASPRDVQEAWCSGFCHDGVFQSCRGSTG